MVFPSGVNTDLQQWRDDALWGYAVQAYEHVQLRTKDQWDDLVLNADGEPGLGPPRLPQQPIDAGVLICDSDGVEIV